MFLSNTSLVAGCSQRNSGLFTGALWWLLAHKLKGVWPGLLLDENVQLSLQTHHGRASCHDKPFMKLTAAKCSATSPGAGGRTYLLPPIAAAVESFGRCGLMVASPAAGSGGGSSSVSVLPYQ